jgi:hypothetical protein
VRKRHRNGVFSLIYAKYLSILIQRLQEMLIFATFKIEMRQKDVAPQSGIFLCHHIERNNPNRTAWVVYDRAKAAQGIAFRA